jgi:hypothetical protein
VSGLEGAVRRYEVLRESRVPAQHNKLARQPLGSLESGTRRDHISLAIGCSPVEFSSWGKSWIQLNLGYAS